MLLSLDGGNESRAHRNAKWDLADKLKRLRGPVHVHYETPTGYKTMRMSWDGLTPVVECAYPSGEAIRDANEYFARNGHYPSMIFDIGLVDKKGKPVAAIEILKSHWIDDAKRRKLEHSPVIAVGVSAHLHEWFTDIHRLDARQLVVPSKRTLAVEIAVAGKWEPIRAH